MNIFEIDKLIIFILFVIPGFLCIKVYELLNPGTEKESPKQIIEAVAFSSINYTILAVPIYYMEKHYASKFDIWYFAFYIIVLFIFPIVIAIVWDGLRKSEFVLKKAPHPTRRPWDFVFSQRKWYWMLVTLKDGRKIGGKYADKSFTSSHSSTVSIYLEECWHVDEKDTFESKRSNSEGILVTSNEIETVELFNFNNGEENVKETN